MEKAVKDFEIKYPVVLDNDFSTWNAYKNQYWPRKYLIDIDGYIVYDHAGEGQYEETEMAIQKALMERSGRLNMSIDVSSNISKQENVVPVDSSKVKSPEVYFGWGRNEFLGNCAVSSAGEKGFSLPKSIFSNKLYLEGIWRFDYEYAENKSAASIIFKYEAKNVYMVASAEADLEIEVYQDGKFMKKVSVKDERLYQLVEGSDYGAHTLEIKIPKVGLKAFTFTFG